MHPIALQRVRLSLMLLALSVSCYAVQAAPPVRMSPLDRAEITTAQSGKTKSGPVAVAGPDKALFRVLHAEFKSAAACQGFKAPKNVWVFHRHGRFADMFVDALEGDAIGDLLLNDMIRWIDVGQIIAVPPPTKEKPSDEKPRDLGQKIVRGGIDGLTGKGVVIAVIDTGIDFRHGDFIVEGKDGKPTSRLLYFWDTLTQPTGGAGPGRKGPYSYPNGAPIGVVYTRDELTADLRAADPRIKVTDRVGHGTACAGIAAGNGAALPSKKYAGVAPAADIIGVRLGGVHSIENAYLLGAVCSWLNEVCGDRPLVVSCSFGGQYGGRDGCLVEERQLDEHFPLTKKSRALCIAAGNEAQMPAHALLRCKGESDKGTAAWSALGGAGIAVYANTADPDDVIVKVTGNPRSRTTRFYHPLSEASVIQVSLPPSDDDDDEAKGAAKGELEVYSKSGKSLEVHAYIYGFGASFVGRARNKGFMVGTPGVAANAITVGSYDFNERFDGNKPIALGFHDKPLVLGAISDYSNPGYSRREKIIKPDFAAPGQYHTAALAKEADAFMTDAAKKYQPFNGTSAATPYAAGVIALLLERKPDLTVGEIKELLHKHVRSDEFTGKTPNPTWGYGKLDYDAVAALVKALKK
jgi:subtilisin family serine protease